MYAYHVSNPLNRESIFTSGLIPKTGICYKNHYEDKKFGTFGDAIFVSLDENKIFDNLYDDDIWLISNNIKYIEDPSMGFPYAYTQKPIPKDEITLIHKGTGEDFLN